MQNRLYNTLVRWTHHLGDATCRVPTQSTLPIDAVSLRRGVLERCRCCRAFGSLKRIPIKNRPSCLEPICRPTTVREQALSTWTGSHRAIHHFGTLRWAEHEGPGKITRRCHGLDVIWYVHPTSPRRSAKCRLPKCRRCLIGPSLYLLRAGAGAGSFVVSRRQRRNCK